MDNSEINNAQVLNCILIDEILCHLALSCLGCESTLSPVHLPYIHQLPISHLVAVPIIRLFRYHSICI